MTAAASATPSFTAGAAPATTPASTVLAGLVGAHPASARVSTELFTATEPAATPRSDLGLI